MFDDTVLGGHVGVVHIDTCHARHTSVTNFEGVLLDILFRTETVLFMRRRKRWPTVVLKLMLYGGWNYTDLIRRQGSALLKFS